MFEGIASMWDLNGKCFVVTGGTKGIGFEICRQLLDHGATVLTCARTEESLQKAGENLNLVGQANQGSCPVFAAMSQLLKVGADW